MIAFNFVTNTEYSGSNAELVGNGKYNAFATFNQIRDAGYMVNKGAHGVRVDCGIMPFTKKDKKTGEVLQEGKCRKYATVFDIIDTNALQDKDLVEFLENGKRFPSKLQVTQELGAALFGGAKGTENVAKAYDEQRKVTKEVPMSEIMPADFLLPELTRVKGPRKIHVQFA